jgi:hypothetical protein
MDRIANLVEGHDAANMAVKPLRGDLEEEIGQLVPARSDDGRNTVGA